MAFTKLERTKMVILNPFSQLSCYVGHPVYFSQIECLIGLIK